MKKQVITTAILIVILAGASLFFLNRNEKSEMQNLPEKGDVDSDDIARQLVQKECAEEDNNAYFTGCAVELLDKKAAEREWKQKKLEAIKHPEINTYDLAGDLKEYSENIKEWRLNFERTRDDWCKVETSFVVGSGVPYRTALCQLNIELRAIRTLDEVYYENILKNVHDSEGISDFEPSSSNLGDWGVVTTEDIARAEVSHTNTEGDTVVRYGNIFRSSTSGDVRFNYYDVKNKLFLNEWEGYPWFFATVSNLDDKQSIDDYVQYLDDHSDSVFKIVGTKEADDCDYYGDGRCLESITVDKIEAVFKP